MKLHKQTKLKAALAAVTAGLMAAFFALVHTGPGAGSEAPPPASPTPDYGGFFAPGREAAPPAITALPAVHARSRAS